MEDSNTSYSSQNREYSRPSGSRALATAAMVLGLIAAPLFFISYISIPLAATAIVLALLSRGDGPMHSRAKISLVVSGVALAASILATAYAVIAIRTNPLLRRELELMLDYFSEYYGYGEDYRLPGIFYGEEEETEPQQETLPPLEEDHGSFSLPYGEDLQPSDQQFIRYEWVQPLTPATDEGGIKI